MQEITYRFRFSDGETATIVAGTGAGGQIPLRLPEWTKLSVHQCPNCPLSVAQESHCPLAIQLVPLMKITSHRYSYDLVDVEVETEARTYTKNTSVQSAMGSLMGLLSATSDCPRTRFLSGMAQFHLPFSTEIETLFRALSSYLATQFLRQKHGEQPDWELKELRESYAQLIEVNLAMAARIRSASEKDGAVNALVILDSLARSLQFSMDMAFEELRPIFENRLSSGQKEARPEE